MVFFRFTLSLIIACFLPSTSFGSNNPQDSRQEKIQEKYNAAISKIQKTAINGPASISLSDQATLELEAAYVFTPKETAIDFMEATGNGRDSNLLGMVTGKNEKWILLIKYLPEGYIREDDAKNWDTDELLKNLKEGTEEANKTREKEGHNTFHVVGWLDAPTYNSQEHKLIYSVESKIDNLPPSNDPNYDRGVNYVNYALGRHGYLQLNLLTDKTNVASDKVHVGNILKKIKFNEGKRYEDFVEGKDHVAEYGLAALVMGAAAKKFGLLAMAGAFLLKMWKIVILAVFGILEGIRRFFGRKNR